MKNHSLLQDTLFALVRAGLWENDVRLSPLDNMDFSKVYKLAEEQSVVGLIAAGIEHVVDVKVPKEVALTFAGCTLQLEQQNKAMNGFVAKLISQLRNQDIYALLVKGQGIAQCYERPLWRSSGDVDLLLSDSNYDKAKKVLIPLATMVETEYTHFKHQGMTVDGWMVELHGTLHSRLSKRVDDGIDNVQKDVFYGGNVRSWDNGGTQVFLPSPDNDVIFVFTHILHHFYIEGIGLRQICDWCRLLWTYRESLNHGLLESRIREAGLMSEWKAFAAFAVKYLGMPIEAMPLFNECDKQNNKWYKKADIIMVFVLESGNFGHNREKAKSKVGSAWKKAKDFARHMRVFPLDSVNFFCHFMLDGLRLAICK